MRPRFPDVPFIRRTLVLARAEVLHVVRDRATLVQIIVMPLIQLLILSNVATFAIKQSPVYVVDGDRTATSDSARRARCSARSAA
jgi:ABC-2 type transport system permease protein